MSNQLLIVVIAIGIIELILVFTFWIAHLRHNKHHPVYRIRHPIFWMVCLCSACIITLSRAIGLIQISYFNFKLQHICFGNIYIYIFHHNQTNNKFAIKFAATNKSFKNSVCTCGLKRGNLLLVLKDFLFVSLS